MELLIRKPEVAALARRILSGLATEGDLQRANIEDVRAIKLDTGETHYRSLAEPIEMKTDSSSRSKRYVASDETVDRMGDKILVKGWDLRNFLKNSVALWAHDARSLPIGRVTEHEKGEHKGMPALLETITYLEEGISPAADAIWKLVEAGVVRAVSVGFLPIKATWPETPEERAELGLGPYGVLFEKQEQLELSNCTIPANPSSLATRSVKTALQEMVQSGQITEEAAKQVIDLGEKRRIQVQVPSNYDELGEATLREGGPGSLFVFGTEGTTASASTATATTGNAECFVVSQGTLHRRSAKSTPPQGPKLLQFELPDDPRLDQIVDGIRQLREEIDMLRSELTEAGIRGKKAMAVDVKTSLKEVVARLGQRIAMENT